MLAAVRRALERYRAGHHLSRGTISTNEDDPELSSRSPRGAVIACRCLDTAAKLGTQLMTTALHQVARFWPEAAAMRCMRRSSSGCPAEAKQGVNVAMENMLATAVSVRALSRRYSLAHPHLYI